MHSVIGAWSKEEGQTPARKVPLVRLIQARALSPASVLEPQPHRIVEKTGDGHECRYARTSVYTNGHESRKTLFNLNEEDL